jgi:ketosteroid isomerase-like protein
MRDIQEGCEGVVQQLERWTGALMAKDFDQLEDILAPDFQFTVDPKFAGGRMNKERFIALDRMIKSCSIQFLGITVRRMGNIATSLAFAEVHEEFSGDLGPGMPSAQEMAATMNGARIAYGSGWRQDPKGEWVCFSHHIFGFIE